MINSTDILSAWQRLGWLEPSKTGYTAILDTDNKKTLSGITFDSLHPLCSFIKFKDTYEDASASAATLNAALKALQQTAILQVLKDVFPDDLVQSGQTLNDHFDMDETLTPTGKFVCLKVVVPRGFVMSIKSIGILLDTSSSFTVYVFNESQQTATDTLAVTSVANAEKWTAASINLWGASSALKSGTYYIGYFQTTGNSIMRYHYKRGGVCLMEYGEATPNGITLPADFAATGYTYGLNIDYAVRRDHSSIYLNATDMFDKAIGYQVVIKVLSQILLTERMNLTRANTREDIPLTSKIFVELNGDTYSSGINKLYQNEIKRLKNQNSKIVTSTIQ